VKKIKTPVDSFCHSGLYLAYIGPKKGRGVFCHAALAKDTLLEIAPVLLLPDADALTLKQTRLIDYIFEVPEISKNTARGSGLPAATPLSGLAMGMASFCNHAAKPNARYTFAEDGTSVYFYLYADSDIAADTEICISYGMLWLSLRDLLSSATNKEA